MTEVWVRANRRALTMALAPVGLLGGLSWFVYCSWDLSWLKVLSAVGVVLAGMLALGLLHQLIRPRVAYREGHVFFYLTARKPIAVPEHLVEAFFLGQGLAMLPGEELLPIAPENGVETVNLVARLSQREPQWQQQEVKRALGRWQDGYVVMRGTWCEPLTEKLIRQLNCHLSEIARTNKVDEQGSA